MAEFLQWAQLIVLFLATFFGFRALRDAQSLRRERDALARDLAAEREARAAAEAALGVVAQLVDVPTIVRNLNALRP